MDGISLFSGDVIGLTGHIGSGKTTLLKVIAGIYEPTSGSVDIDGSVMFYSKCRTGHGIKWNREYKSNVFT